MNEQFKVDLHKMILGVIQSQTCATDTELEANPKLSSLGCDSLDFVEMIMTIEDMTGKEIDDDAAGDMEQTVSEFIANIAGQIRT